MDDDTPGFGVDFVIDAGESFGEMARLAATMESAEAKILAEAQRIEKATSGMINVAGATAEVKTFGVAATRELAAAAREIRTVEKAGEAMIRQLERQAATFGKTREEIRGMRAEERAQAAERTGNLDLAQRIRATEQAIFDQELAASRRVRAEAEAAAQDKAAAAAVAVAAAEREAQAIREAAQAHAMFEAAARRGMVAWKEQQAAEAAIEKSSAAAALRNQAAAADLAARQQAELAATLRASHAALQADAAAADRMRAATDPLYAATSRLNAEIAESTRLYYAGATAPAEYARQQEVLAGRLRAITVEHDAMSGAARRGAGSLTQLSFQINDVATMAAMGAPPFQIFASQIGQIIQVAQMAEGGVKGFAAEIGSLATRFAPLAIIAAGAGVALYQWQQQIEKDAGMKAYVKTLGLTHKEMKKLGDQSVTTGDMLKGFWKAINEGAGGPSLMSRLFTDADKQVLQDLLDFGINVFKGIAAAAYGLVVGSYRAAIAVWNQFPAALADLFVQAVNGAANAIEFLINKGIGAVNAIARASNAVIGKDLFGQVDAVQIGRMKNSYAGAAATLGKDVGDAFNGAVEEALKGMDRIGRQTGQFAKDAARERARKKAEEIIADRTPKTDKHAEQLARQAAAVEAQIRNLYALADAYGVSGAAALIAEARVKAESQAIKARGDIEAAVDRQVRLSIAQRVSDAAKAAAATREEAAVQAEVNAMIAAGLVPAERANDLVRDRIADLPLLAAIEAAQQRGLKAEVDKATAALKAQQDARAAANGAEVGAFYAGADQQAERQLAMQREELRLVGATDMARTRALAALQAKQTLEAKGYELGTAYADSYIAKQVQVAVGAEQNRQAQDAWNASLGYTADLFDEIDRSAQRAASGMADAFGEVGRTIGDVATIMTGYYADQASLQQAHDAALRKAGTDQRAIAHEQQLFAMRTSSLQIGAFGDMASAAKGFFKEGSDGYHALAAAEKAFRLVQFALSVRAIAQDAIETGSKIAGSVARTAASATEAVVNAIKSLPFPLNLAAGAATIGALAAIGVSVAGGFGGSKKPEPSNTGTGTVLGDADAKSESLKRAIDQLREVDTITSVFARQMAGSLRSIDDQIGGLAAVLVRSGNVDASAGVAEGFKTNAVGSVLKAIVPVFGGALSSLFGTKTSVVAGGLYGGAQSVGNILAGGFDASTYSDVQKKKKLFGITTSTKYSTEYGAADAGLENQFTLILRGFATAIAGAADPLGEATDAVQARLNGFVVNIGKIDLKGLTGTEIQEKLEAVFGAAADGMAQAAFPGVARFQKAGEGLFETLVRVASTLEAVSSSLDLLGSASRAMSIDAKLGLADQFDSIGDLTSAVDAYFATYFSDAEQSAAKTAQLGRVFASMGMVMPSTLTGFRQLVEAQDLTTAAGQATYATLLQLAPAFADLQKAMAGAKSAADVAAERRDLERKILELNGDTAALRALDLAKLDASNRGLQEQIYAIQDAQEAAKAAEELRQAWTSVGDSIMDEVRRIRGLTDTGGGNGFAELLGRFNAANAAARGGDMDAAKGLPALSQALLSAAADAATSRQELARVQAATAAQLEATYGVVGALTASKPASITAQVTAAAAAQGTPTQDAANDDLVSEIKSLREEVAGMRRENNSTLATIAGNTGRTDRRLADVTADSSGTAISVASAA